MNSLKKYAELVAKVGINVQPKEEIWVNTQTEQLEFVEYLVEELYKAGARKVRVRFSSEKLARLDYKYMSTGDLSKVPSYSLQEYKYMKKYKPHMVHVISEDPDAFKGLNIKKIAKSNFKKRMKVKPYHDAIDGKYKWCIVAVPSLAWAKKVFPKLSDEEAVNKLWDAILKTTRVDDNAIENWNKHNDFLIKQRQKLGKLNLRYLEYKSSNGTDFKVELIKGIQWGGGVEWTDKGLSYNPNMPTEEVFTSPIAGKAEGILVASKPLSYNGSLIEDFSITFKDGKVSEVKAKHGQKVLEEMVKMDEGAAMLGEVALVAYDTPIRQSGILFYNTLFDENAACHVALGAGFKECLPNGVNLTNKEAHKLGINDSVIHVDFMIGTKDLSIVGIGYDNKKTVIFKDGNWAI